MITLPVKPLLEFIRLSSPIVTNSILPIHKYLHLSKAGVLSKTSGSKFICFQLEASVEQDILLEELPLNAFVKFTRAAEINIDIKPIKGSTDVKVTLYDGTMSQSFQSPLAVHFDKLPLFDESEAIDLDSDVLQAIGVAKNCVSEIGGGANFDFIHLSGDFVFGTDKGKLYAKRFNGITEAYFDKECAAIISQFTSLIFCKKDKFNLFKNSQVLYGFLQFGDIKPPDIKPFLQKRLEGDYFEFQSSDLIRFCELVQASIPLNQKEVAECTMTGGELYCFKEEYGKEVKMTIPATGNFTPKLKFNPKLLAPYIRALGIPSLRFYDFGKVGVYLGDMDDADFIGMYAALN